jgi:gluconate 5-dehydrogenase
MDLFDLSGKVALVTGASGHLGTAIAEGLAEAGARVAVSSRSLARAQEVARLLPSPTGEQHVAVEFDHLDSKSIERGFDAALEQMTKIDILVNNGHQPTKRTWHDTTPEEFTRQLENATGYFVLARLVRNHAVERIAPASIVMLGSMYGSVGSYPEVYEGISSGSPVAYQVLKGGIAQLARHLAVSWAVDGVRVNTISPGPFPDPHRTPVELVERLAKKTPLGRCGSPEELKGAVVFLASDASSFVTGHNLFIDGGWTAW